MTSDRKSSKSFPSILSKLKAMNTNNSNNSVSMESRDDGSRSRLDTRVAPRLAWMARKESTASGASTITPMAGLGGGGGGGGNTSMDTPLRSASILSRIPSVMSLGGASTAWGKRLKKKRDAEEYAAQKLERQKQEMVNFYKGTPLTDDRATSSEILRFLYEIWEPQLCSSYRPDVKITTTCRQDLRTARRIVQTTPRRIARLHRARLIIDASGNRTGSSNTVANDSAPNSARGSSMVSRPISAKSIT